MEWLTIDVPYERLGEPHHLTIYSDLHDDASACDAAKLDRHMKKRAALPNAMFFGNGDIGNWVMPGNDRRHNPSTPLPQLAHRDDYIDHAIELQAARYRPFPWIAIGEGNHEEAIRRHHHTCVTSRLCRELGVPFAGYSGMLNLRFVPKKTDRTSARCMVSILYHHGAWGGKVQKGFGGARDFARAIEGWDIFAYGHNHQLNVHQETRFANGGRLDCQTREVFFVNTGTFQKGLEIGGTAAYSEIKGYAPVSLAAPLITLTPTKAGTDAYHVDISISVGEC